MSSPCRLLAVPAACVALALAACGGSGDGGGTTTTANLGPAPAQAPRAGDVQQRFVEVVHTASPRVVQIQTDQGLGSGVVYDANGNIVTNNHVVGTSKNFMVTLEKGDRHSATLVGTYPPEDLAVIRLDNARPEPAPFGDSAKLLVGQLVLAIGNPLGLRSSVTDGIISSLGRTVSEGNGAVIGSAVQTSAPINPGNSGGALVDLESRVVGIPTLAAIDPQLGGGQAAGIGFAIPSNTVKRIASQLIANGKVTRSGRAFLGVQIASTVAGAGVLVAAVEKNGPADRAGLRPGDIITMIDGKPTPTADDLATVLAGLHPGQTVPVTVVRDPGTTITLHVKLGENPG